MQTEAILYIISAGIIALLLALFQYIYKSKKHSKVTVLLTFLRFLTIFSILLLLINPKFDSTLYYNEKPRLVVTIDNSESVKYLEQDKKVKNFVALLKNDDGLNERFDLEFFTFGKNINTLDSLAFNEKQTNPT